MPLCFPEQSCQLLLASTLIVCILHSTAFALVSDVLQIAVVSGQFLALIPLNGQPHCHSWILSSPRASLSLGSRFWGHHMLWGFPSFSHSFSHASLSLWSFSRAWELSSPFAVLLICRCPSFNAIQTEVPCKFVSGGQPTLKMSLVRPVVSLTAPLGCLVGVLNLAFP